ncbi:MAG: HigA family addiction module antitoxin [Leptospirales bacterium]|nr:HigA family addiction module antitoxin [Leptospirales bacterium]
MANIKLQTTGEILKEEFIVPYGISQNALANAIGVPANRIHQIVKGTRTITADTDLRLCKFFSLSDGFFLRLQEDYEIRMSKKKMSKILDNIIPINNRDLKTKII